MYLPSGKAYSMEEPVHDGDLQGIQAHSDFRSVSRCDASTSSRSPSARQTERSTRLTFRPRSASPTAGAARYKFWRSLSQVLQVARLRENTAQAKSVPLFSGDPARNFRMVAQGLLSQGILFLLVRCADVMREVALGAPQREGKPATRALRFHTACSDSSSARCSSKMRE